MDGSSTDKSVHSTSAASGRSDSVSDRRDFLSTASTVVMAGGLLAGYGTFVAMAGRYVFPTEVETPWLFVAETRHIQPGESLAFESPTGVKVTIARRAADGANRAAETDDFIALSSICPHLGCRVHWELNNQRFFCPCHNGVFDPEGKPISGPPKAAGQELSRYRIKVEGGLLYIAMSIESVGGAGRIYRAAVRGERPSRVASGHSTGSGDLT